MSPPRVSSDMADDSWVQRVVDAASVTVSQHNLSTVSQPVLEGNRPSLRSRTRPSKQSQTEFAQSTVWMQRPEARALESLNTRMHSFKSGARDSLHTYSHLANHLDLRGVQPQPPILNQSSAVPRRPAHDGSVDASPKPGKEQRGANTVLATPEHQYPQDAEHQRSAVFGQLHVRTETQHGIRLVRMRPRRWCFLKSNARRVVTMLVSN